MKRITTLLAVASLALAATAAVAAAAGAHAAGAGAIVSTRSTSLGTVLVAGNGRTLYLYNADKKNKSNCSGGCAVTWPPLTTKGSPKAKGSAKSSELGTISRSGGVKQVTYDGHPLYEYIGDSAAGQTTGEAVGGFYAVSRSGAAITKSTKGTKSTSSGGGW
jgi:predicted lipoprotein with Yx(FWY)xxD motif